MSDILIVGGNQVRLIGSAIGLVPLADAEYFYAMLTLAAEDAATIAIPADCTVMVPQAEPGARVEVDDPEVTLALLDALRLEGASSVRVKASGGSVTVLVGGAGQVGDGAVAPRWFHTVREGQYKVSKPWGHEIWISGDRPGYCLKEVSLNVGTRTSLQFHQYKRETNLLLEGAVRLVYKSAESVANLDVGPSDLGQRELVAPCAIDVTPGILHRLEALTDATLYEVSTPHLDDVIRVADDLARGHGRIISEHGAS